MTLLTILSPQEKRRFELPPTFTSDERSVNFLLTPTLKKYISRMDNYHIRAGFLLQLAYFRANARFYPVDQFKKRDIQHVKSTLQCGDINLEKYNSTINSKHRLKIRLLQDWVMCDSTAKILLSNYASRQASNQVKPRDIFIGLIDQCWNHRICIPTYSEMCEIITNCFNVTEHALLDELKICIDDEQLNYLETILTSGTKAGSRSQPMVTELKSINQGLKPSEIQESIKATLIFSNLFVVIKKLLGKLTLNDSATEYYATWFSKVDFQQLTRSPNRYKVYLYLIAFIKHQYYSRQDALVDVLQKSVTGTLHSVISKHSDQDQETKKERNEALHVLNNSHKSILTFSNVCYRYCLIQRFHT